MKLKTAEYNEVAALEIYHQYWVSYQKGDLETFASILDEDFEMIETSESGLHRVESKRVEAQSMAHKTQK